VAALVTLVYGGSIFALGGFLIHLHRPLLAALLVVGGAFVVFIEGAFRCATRSVLGASERTEVFTSAYSQSVAMAARAGGEAAMEHSEHGAVKVSYHQDVSVTTSRSAATPMEQLELEKEHPSEPETRH
jgi:hypothetical protein